ncbi:GGDEF domain-containing protein [Aquincola sp. S2]|uniref:diguanylate cyclase n=1 Tax=Pseudaquabacterium terrae TaxID=2732868 RepID=A0ABX2EAJ8_9BURK|nr:GGDEF domain-containing protein [Aquabacterium terrae]NRF65858.1 GGDEF domain-containing protein [Aquabacterium terrae]
MPSLSRPNRPRPSADDGAESAEARGLRWLLVIGAVLIALVCAIEWAQGVINAWDRWLQPAMSVLQLAYAAALARWPQHTPRLRLAAVVTFNSYLVATVLLLLFAFPPPLNQYQFLSTVYWLPLGYGTAFVFLRPRVALAVSAVIFALLFVPLGLVLASRGAAHWGPDFGSLAAVLAVAQVAYIVLLAAIATIRAGYHRAEERARLMQTLATTDPLTELPNRRAMGERLHAALAAARRHAEPVTVALIDVDHFKRINDGHGHAAGDRVLVQLGRLLAADLRASDQLGRWGGEEFLLVCGHTRSSAGIELAERLRNSVAAFAFGHGARVTVSIGVAQVESGDDADAVLARADAALYRAKDAGRNRVELANARASTGQPLEASALP